MYQAISIHVHRLKGRLEPTPALDTHGVTPNPQQVGSRANTEARGSGAALAISIWI